MHAIRPQLRDTLAYQPPEVLADQCVVTRAADCYAFGVLLFEMLTAKARPYQLHCLAPAFPPFCVGCGRSGQVMCFGTPLLGEARQPQRQGLHYHMSGTVLVCMGKNIRYHQQAVEDMSKKLVSRRG